MNMKTFLIGLCLVMLLLVPVACSQASESSEGGVPVPAPVPAPMAPDRDDIVVKYTGDEGTSEIPQERMIVRNGYISLVVENVTWARDEIAQLAANLGGYVVSSEIRGEAVSYTHLRAHET